MYQDIRAQKGRFLLRALLWLIFVAQFAQALIPFIRAGGSLEPPMLLFALAPLLPSAVVLWALHRGNWAALAVFCLIGLEQIAAFSYWILPRYQEAMAPVDSLGSASLVLTVIDLVLRLIVLYQMFSGSTVPVWLECRRDMRRRKDLILELALFGVSILAAVVLLFLTL